MHASDRLMGHLRGPGKNMIVLATAFSDPKQEGTGQDEPVLLALTYGKGRVFHTLLGRTDDGTACVGYQLTLARGAEWAASGKVTLRVPADFPTENKVSTRERK
jgi:type 1 glutamine amidotransferase